MYGLRKHWKIVCKRDNTPRIWMGYIHPKNESSAAEEVVTEEYLLLQMNLFFWSR
jgi:hypothetical protein